MDKDFYNELIDEIKQENMYDLAYRSGVAYSTLHYWVTGKTKHPRLLTISKVVNALGMRIKLVGKPSRPPRRRPRMRVVK